MSFRVGRGLLATYLRPEVPRIVLLGTILGASLILQLANPLIARSFIDAAGAGRPFGRLLHLAVLFAAVALAAQVGVVAESYVANDLGWRTTNQLRRDLTRKVLQLDAVFHARHNAGQLVERIDGDVTAVAGFFSRFVVYVLGNGLFLAGVLAVVFAFDWRIGGLLAAFAVAALVFMTHGGFVGRKARAARIAVADLSGFIEERLGGLPDLKSNGADSHVMRGLHLKMADRYRTARASTMAAATFTAGISGFFVLGTGTSLALSAWLYQRSSLSLGTVFAVLRYTTMLRYPLEALTRQMNSLQQAMGGLVRIRELLDIEPKIADGPGGRTELVRTSGPLSVDFDRVSFAYGGDPVLSELSFHLSAGEVLGLAGRTGAGKTTVSRLLFRLYDPVAGSIRLDGVDIRQARLDEVRGRIGMVTQEVHLFQGSVRDNVTLFDRNVPDDRLHEVLTDLGLEAWLRRLPDGLDTNLGPSGLGLSAGEAQLVALSRVFLADPGLVILDEPSSRIDPATEALLERAIDRLLAGRTAVVIAHRLSTLDRADSVLVLEAGRAVESGWRTDLESDPTSRYSWLRRLAAAEAPA